MPDEQIKVSITGDASGLDKSAGQATASLNKFDKSVQVVNKALPKLNKESGAAQQSLINLSRVAQDAPFGFIGIANNLNPLLESFQRLRAESGSTGTALKSLAGSLTGAGGIGLALGVVSSLLVVFGDKLFGSKKEAEGANEAVEKLNKSLEASRDRLEALEMSMSSLKALGDINLKITGQNDRIGLQADNIDTLGLINALEDQKVAVQKKLRDVLNVPGFADALKAEFDKVPAIVRTLTPAKLPEPDYEGIKKTAKEQSDILLKEETRLQKEINAARDKLRIGYRQVELDRVEDQKEANQEALANAKAAQAKRDAQNARELAAYKKYMAEMAKLYDFLEAYRTRSRNGLNDDFSQVPEIVQPRDRRDQYIAGEQSRQKDESIFGLPTKAELDKMYKDIDDKARAYQQRMESLADTITGSVAPAFQDMFGAILAGESPLQAFFQSIGQSIQQLISQLIAAAVKALVLSALTGGAKGALGGFAKIFGGAIGIGGTAGLSGGALGSGGRFAGGGIAAQGGQVRFEIQGNSLVGVLARTNQSQGRNG